MIKKRLAGFWTDVRAGGLSPVFLALWPVLSLYHQNAAECPPGAIVRSLAALGVVGGTAAFVSRVVFTDRAIASLHASFFVLLFAGGGAGFAALDRLLPDSAVGAVIAETAVLLLLLVAYLGLLRSARSPARAWRAPVNGAVAIGAAALFFSTGLLGLVASAKHAAGGAVPVGAPPRRAPPEAPDLYLIIVDGYGRADVLKDVLSFDNTPFLRELEKRGFRVAARSRSNYPVTPDAIASMLNLADLERADRTDPRALIRQNRFQALARTAGYRLISVDSGWLITSSFPQSDLEVRSLWRLNEFERRLLGLTAIGTFFPMAAAGDQRRTLERNLRFLRDLPDQPERPTCVVAHIVLPHPPYLFDESGRDPRRSTDFNLMGPWKDPTGYIDQLRFLNNRLLDAFDSILARSRVPPVLLLVSDHGSCFRGWVGAGTGKLMEERTSVLLAVAGPPALRATFYDSITPVNAVRNVARAVLGFTGGPVPDKVHWGPDRTKMEPASFSASE